MCESLIVFHAISEHPPFVLAISVKEKMRIGHLFYLKSEDF